MPTSLNFSGGPGALPAEVLEQTAEAIHRAPGTNQSLLGISHRSDWFRAVLDESEAHVRALLDLPDDWHVLQLQGGSTLQFAMVPMLLLRGRTTHAEYLRTGYWSQKSIPDATLEGAVRVVYDGKPHGYRRLPSPDTLACDSSAAYLHYVSNETVEGLQFHWLPGHPDVPRVCDMSSDFLSRPFDIQRYGIVYAHAQKNLGPSGLTLVLVKGSLLRDVPDGIPSLLDYRNHVEMKSIFNTPPVFAMYVTMLVLRWLRHRVGGLANMAAINARKAAAVYAMLDAHPGVYRTHADPRDRSLMNVAFTLPDASDVARFLAASDAAGFYGLEGHRSLGGLRASLYNAVSEEDVARLVQFLEDFARGNA